jgi:putative flippase GtrA
MSSPVHHEALRFLVAGAINTLVSYALYLGLLTVLSYTLAYTITYVAGIGLSYLLNQRYVFRVPANMLGAVLFPLVYLFQYLVGVWVLRVAVDGFAISARLALIASIIATIPLTFLLSRTILKSRDFVAAGGRKGNGGVHDP